MYAQDSRAEHERCRPLSQVKNVINFLAQLASCAQLNDSSVAALAFVFAPILSRPPGSAFMSVRHLQVRMVSIQR